MIDYYKNWFNPNSINRFANKNIRDFFRSEIYFLKKIGTDTESVLDIGCASGRFIELVRQFSPNVRYTGIDIVQESIAIGRKLYQDADFHVASGLEYQTNSRFDLVNATGVFQHEPKYMELLRRMISWSEKYVLFDVKLAALENHIIDLDVSFCETNGDRMYFNVLSWGRFKESLFLLNDIEAVSIYGYQTRPNKVTIVPESIEPLVSAGVLLKKGDTMSIDMEVELPDFLVLD